MLEDIFCPKNVVQERHLQGVLNSLIFSACMPYSDGCPAPTSIEKSIITHTSCQRAADMKGDLIKLRNFITRNLTAMERTDLEKAGFCMMTSPMTSRISVENEPNRMVVCANCSPDSEDQLEIPTPSKSDIIKSIANTRVAISRFVQQNDLVTIARSNRDGFVARELQPFIEDKLLNSLTNLLERSNVDYNIIQDPNLFVRV